MFLIRPNLISDETLESYLLRVAAENGRESFSTFWRQICSQLSQQTEFSGSIPTSLKELQPYKANISSGKRVKLLIEIARLCNTEPQMLLRSAVLRGAREFSTGYKSVFRDGISLPRVFLRRDSVPVCPDCWQDSEYIRYIWHLKPFTHCPKHGKPLVNQCQCGARLNYVSNKKISHCHQCGKSILNLTSHSKPCDSALKIAQWLTGEQLTDLPETNISHRYGLILWWQLFAETQDINDFDYPGFIKFFQKWPHSFDNWLTARLSETSNLGLKPLTECTFKDVFGNLLIISSRLPESNLQNNLILRQLMEYVDRQILNMNGEIGHLRLNAIEAAILLGTTTDQIAAMLQQGQISTTQRIKSSQQLSVHSSIFALGDVYCCWLTGSQHEQSNRNIFTSRW